MAKKDKVNPVEGTDKASAEFVNPFTPGVTYDQFLEAKGDQTVIEYCGENLEPEQIEWLIIELDHYKNK